MARDNLEVTDDVSIIEALGKPVKITRGAYTNIKVTPKGPIPGDLFSPPKGTVMRCLRR